MFKLGDFVAHKNEGVCKVVDIKTVNYGDGDTEYYILSPIYEKNRSTIMIPVNHAVQIRPLITKKEALKIIAEIPNSKDVWVTDTKKRREFFQKIVYGGDIESICSLLHTIYYKREEYASLKKEMPLSDKNLSAQAEKLFNEEFSLALGIEVDEVNDFINKELQRLDNSKTL